MNQSEKIKKVATLLKKKVPNLTTGEAIDLAFKIVQMLEEEQHASS